MKSLLNLGVSGAVLVALLAGCGALPSSGPTSVLINRFATDKVATTGSVPRTPYAFVALNPRVIAELPDKGPGSINKSFGSGGPSPEIRLGIGDVVQITVFESGSGGLFTPTEGGSRQGNFVTLPAQAVDRQGNITMPFAGQIKAAGRKNIEIQREIEEKLAKRALEPQILLTVLQQRASEAAVLGDVQAPSKVSINPAGDRVLDVISKAGGIRYAGYETFVTLQRNGNKATVYFNELIANPKENVFVAPGDALYVFRQQRSFLVFGATGLTGEFKFDAEKLSLVDAVARAGGIDDSKGNPRQTFVYRLQDRATLEKIGVDVASFPGGNEPIATIYRANMRDPAGLFLAQRFPMEDGDIVYVSNADQIELNKFLNFVTSLSNTSATLPANAISTRNAVRTLEP